MAIALLPDHVFVLVTQQRKQFVPGVYEWPIGMAYEAIKNGFAKIDPRSAKQYSDFEKQADKRK